jgi:hypothetical protein
MRKTFAILGFWVPAIPLCPRGYAGTTCPELREIIFNQILTDPTDGYKFVLRGQFHLKIAANAVFGQIALNIAGWKLNGAAIISGGDDIFGDTLVDAEKLLVTQVKSETDKLIAGHVNSTVPVETGTVEEQINVDFAKRRYALPVADGS